jgi:hypothetical protein
VFFAAAASIVIAAGVPAYQMQAKRAMEEELIFRGQEYSRAIQKYQRRFGIYPTSIDQLVSTNGLRFLRRAYKDPITGKDFRLITINPDGSLSGSKVFMQNTNTQGLFGNTQTNTNQQGPGQQSLQPQQPGQQGQQRGQFSPQGQFGAQQSQFGAQLGQFGAQQNQQRGFQAGSLQQSQNAGGANPTFGAQPNQPNQTTQSAQQRGFQPGGQQGPFSAGGAAIGTPVGNGGIIGVASDSDKDSIKVYNQRQKYSQWEFLAILGQRGQQGQQPPNGQPQQPGVPPNQAPGQQTPFQNAPPNPFGGQPAGSPMNPGGGSPLNPFSGQPTGSPLNPGRGQRQPQSPFGFGGTPQPQMPQPGR